MKSFPCLAVVGFTFLMTWHGASAASWTRIGLKNNWHLRQLEPTPILDPATLAGAINPQGSDWLAAPTMPAMVHDILREHGVIEAPWLPGRAEACRWVAQKDWLYATQFRADAPNREAWLHFKGLDTIVDVYLNGERIASHSNMYLPLQVNVTGRLRPRNTLVLHFHTVFDLSGDKPKPIRRLPGDPPRRVTRPNNSYNKYLGPNPWFSRVGVYDGVFLEFTGGAEMTGDADGDAFGWLFEDNYFDLMPGETKIVRVLGHHDAGQITAKPHYSSEGLTVEWKR